MRFLVDAQLPPALARLLRDHGHVAEHVTEIGRGDAPDRDLWRYALENDAVIVTKDEDFSLTFAMRGEAPTVVWVRLGNSEGGSAQLVRAHARPDRRADRQRAEAHRASLTPNRTRLTGQPVRIPGIPVAVSWLRDT